MCPSGDPGALSSKIQITRYFFLHELFTLKTACIVNAICMWSWGPLKKSNSSVDSWWHIVNICTGFIFEERTGLDIFGEKKRSTVTDKSSSHDWLHQGSGWLIFWENSSCPPLPIMVKLNWFIWGKNWWSFADLHLDPRPFTPWIKATFFRNQLENAECSVAFFLGVTLISLSKFSNQYIPFPLLRYFQVLICNSGNLLNINIRCWLPSPNWMNLFFLSV